MKIAGRTSTAHVPIQRLSALTPVPLPPVPASTRKPAAIATPEKNLALGKPCTSPNAPYATNMGVANLVDGDASTPWVAKEYGKVLSNVWAEVDLGAPTTFNKVRLGPDYGNRIEGFRIDYFDGGVWKTAAIGGAAREDRYYEAYVRNASATSMARLVFQSGDFKTGYTQSYGEWRAVGASGWTRLRLGTAGITVAGDVEVYVENNHATETFYVDDVKGVRCYESQPATVVFPAVTGTKMRLYITSALGSPAPYEMGIYLEPGQEGGK